MADLYTKVRSAFRAAARAFKSGNLEPADSSRGGRVWRTIGDFRTGSFQQDDTTLGEGEQINVLATAVVYACLRLLVWDISKLPAQVCRLVKGVWTEERHKWLTPLIRRPNYYQGWIDFIQSWLFSYFIAGNAYIIKVRGTGTVTQMLVLDPALVQPMVDRETGAIVYRVGLDPLTPISAEDTLVPASEIIHHRYMAFGHPLIGTSLLARAQMAASMRTGILEANANLATNNAVPPGVLIAPEGLSPDQLAEIERVWNARKSGKIPVVDAAFKFESLQAKFIDSQSKEFAEVGAVDVCCAMGVPPWKVGMATRPMSANVESANIIYYQDSLQLPIEHIEQVLDIGLEVAEDVYIRLCRDELFLLDSATRANVHAILVKGIMAPDEARAQWNLPPVAGGADVYMQQQNYSLSALQKRDQAAPAPSASATSPGGQGDAAGPADESEEDAEGPEQQPAAASTGLPWKRVYDAGREYHAGDFVTHRGHLWHANIDVCGVEPGTEHGTWGLAAKGARGRPVEVVE